MRAVISHKGAISVINADAPTGPGVLVTVTSAGICGSDLHLVAAGLSGVILGHEFGGTLADGRLVAVRPTGECGSCMSCTQGMPNTCSSALTSLHGTSINGGLADNVLVEESRIIEMPARISPHDVALVEPLAVVIHGIHRVQLQAGMKALVVGAGSIGLLTAAALIDIGVQVDIVARHSHQTNAANNLGARTPTELHPNYDVSFDAVCTQASFDLCVEHTRPTGSLVEFGMFWTPVTLSNKIMLKEISIVPSIFYNHDHSSNDFTEAADLLSRSTQLRNILVSHSFSLEDAAEAFRIAGDKISGALKVHFYL